MHTARISIMMSMTYDGPKIDLFEAAVDLVVNAINVIKTTKT